MKNPYKVKKGQLWKSTDSRRQDSEIVLVLKTSPSKGVAVVASVGYSGGLHPINPRTIRLDRFSPRHHYRKVA